MTIFICTHRFPEGHVSAPFWRRAPFRIPEKLRFRLPSRCTYNDVVDDVKSHAKKLHNLLYPTLSLQHFSSVLFYFILFSYYMYVLFFTTQPGRIYKRKLSNKNKYINRISISQVAKSLMEQKEVRERRNKERHYTMSPASIIWGNITSTTAGNVDLMVCNKNEKKGKKLQSKILFCSGITEPVIYRLQKMFLLLTIYCTSLLNAYRTSSICIIPIIIYNDRSLCYVYIQERMGDIPKIRATSIMPVIKAEKYK